MVTSVPTPLGPGTMQAKHAQHTTPFTPHLVVEQPSICLSTSEDSVGTSSDTGDAETTIATASIARRGLKLSIVEDDELLGGGKPGCLYLSLVQTSGLYTASASALLWLYLPRHGQCDS